DTEVGEATTETNWCVRCPSIGIHTVCVLRELPVKRSGCRSRGNSGQVQVRARAVVQVSRTDASEDSRQVAVLDYPVTVQPELDRGEEIVPVGTLVGCLTVDDRGCPDPDGNPVGVSLHTCLLRRIANSVEVPSLGTGKRAKRPGTVHNDLSTNQHLGEHRVRVTQLKADGRVLQGVRELVGDTD